MSAPVSLERVKVFFDEGIEDVRKTMKEEAQAALEKSSAEAKAKMTEYVVHPHKSTTTEWIVFGLVSIVVMAIAPLISLVAIPIFVMKALPKWIEHRSLYNKTVTNLTREKFGRVAGQDYTCWDGKVVHQVGIDPKTVELLELVGVYVRGGSDQEAPDCPFRTKEDLEWLNHEFTRREKKELLDSDLKMLRVSLKAFIPVIGIIWIAFTETGLGGAFEIGCRCCHINSILEQDARKILWDWNKAIDFHRNNLQKRLEI